MWNITFSKQTCSSLPRFLMSQSEDKPIPKARRRHTSHKQRFEVSLSISFGFRQDYCQKVKTFYLKISISLIKPCTSKCWLETDQILWLLRSRHRPLTVEGELRRTKVRQIIQSLKYDRKICECSEILTKTDQWTSVHPASNVDLLMEQVVPPPVTAYVRVVCRWDAWTLRAHSVSSLCSATLRSSAMSDWRMRNAQRHCSQSYPSATF
jgi:hypothetical protein